MFENGFKICILSIWREPCHRISIFCLLFEKIFFSLFFHFFTTSSYKMKHNFLKTKKLKNLWHGSLRFAFLIWKLKTKLKSIKKWLIIMPIQKSQNLGKFVLRKRRLKLGMCSLFLCDFYEYLRSEKKYLCDSLIIFF